MISLIVAHDVNFVMGKDNKMPWHIREDLAYFKKMTMGKAMVMGRKTFESIGKALPGRLTVIVTRNPNYEAEDAKVVQDFEEALKTASDYADEVMVIGGGEIFNLALPLADRLYVTLIEKEYEGDTFFPNYGDEWNVVKESEEKENEDGTRYKFLVYERSQ
ncbi:dihydrofolate reductase [Chungangia koreensis]|uniref:Dihydrofolate reductase n=1 Tax=Chungangia koreensis TaxID=752657 RepID=A0ABV8X7A6_9LACT